jgi:hypothetical protein
MTGEQGRMSGGGIVERLRSGIGPQWADDAEMARLLRVAAAEIERQAAEIERLRALVTDAADVLAAEGFFRRSEELREAIGLGKWFDAPRGAP